MKICAGIIAEFNPLHKGHEALMNFVRGQKNFSGCVVVLSSNFTQRGSPAVIDKFARAQMALEAGADLVLELPFLFACSAGQDFSRGAVDILGRTHAATHIAFGMETPEFDFEPLIDAVESEKYREFLHVELSNGASFPKAHALALEKILPGAGEFISMPNNLLAFSYVKKIREKNFALEKMIFQREKNFSSKKIREGKNFFMMPKFSRKIFFTSRHADEKKLWPLLQNIFIRENANGLKKIYGIDEGIENLFLKHWRDSSGLDDFIGRCVCARYTRAHIRRRLVYILLGLDRWKVQGAIRGGAPYARVLGFTQRGREILRECSKKSEIKIITRLKDAEGARGKFFAETEMRASQLYELLTDEPDMTRETQKPLIV